MEMTSDKCGTPNSIAVVGASARAAAFSILRTGRSAVAADLFADADLVQHCPTTKISPYPEGLADWLAATDVDAWLYTGALENYPDLVDQLAAVRPLLGNSGEPLRRCRDPSKLQTVLAKNGLHFPETRTSCEKLPSDGSWLCKTYRGSSGSGVWELAGEASRRQAAASGACFQKRIEGKPASVVFALSDSWTTLLGMTAQWVGTSAARSATFQYAGSHGLEQAISPTVQEQIKTLAQVLANQFQLCGLVGVDLVLDSGRAWILEINPRYTASVEVIERNTGVSAIAAHLAACTGTALGCNRQAKSRAKTHGKAILYAKQAVTINTDFYTWAMAQSGHGLGSQLADIPAVESKILNGRPVLTIFAEARANEIEKYLRQRLAEAETRLYARS